MGSEGEEGGSQPPARLSPPAGSGGEASPAPPRSGLRCPSEPGGESRGGVPEAPTRLRAVRGGGLPARGVRTCAGAARLASAGRAAHSRPRAAG